MIAALRAHLEHDLAERLEREQVDVALHIGCGAVALGIIGPIEPAARSVESTSEEPQTL